MNYSRPLAPRAQSASRYINTQNQSPNGQPESVALQTLPPAHKRTPGAPPPPPAVVPYRGVQNTTPGTAAATPRTPAATPRTPVATPRTPVATLHTPAAPLRAWATAQASITPYVAARTPYVSPIAASYVTNNARPYVSANAASYVTNNVRPYAANNGTPSISPTTPLPEVPAEGFLQRAQNAMSRHWKLSLTLGLLATAAIVGATAGVLSHKSHGGGANNTPTTPWLFVNGTHVYQAPASWNGIGTPPEGTLWRGRGANIQDTRGCAVCNLDLPVAEVQRRIDALASYDINLMRLTLESNSISTDMLQDPEYFGDVQEIVNYIGTKPNMYVEVSLWIDPTFTDMGWPSAQTDIILAKLAQTFANDSHVFFGVCNEPKSNSNGVNDTLVWTAMNNAVTAIRTQEGNGPQHMVAVQGTRRWAQDLSYYVTNPITADNGSNVLYEVHVYDSQENFQAQIFTPAAKIPVLIGEYGPASLLNEGTQTVNDSIVLMQLARNANIPHIAWNFHMNCGPNLLVNNLTPDNLCGIGVPLQLSPEWGQPWQQGMAAPWA